MSARRVGVGIVGAGFIGHAHAAALAGAAAYLGGSDVGIDRVGVSDPNSDAAADAARRYGFASVAASWEELAADPAVEVVVVASPDAFHKEAVVGLVAAGKHVLCEKPLAVALDDVRAMVEAVERAGVVGAVSHEFRRIPSVSALRWHVANGDLGPILHFHGRFLSDFGHPPADRTTWRFFGPVGSGSIVDIGSHVIDLAQHLVGPIVEVSGARIARLADVVERNEDSVAFTGRFADGAIGSFALSRLAIGKPASLELDVYGLSGAGSFDMQHPGEYRLRTAQDPPGTDSRRMLAGLDDPAVTGGRPTGAGSGLGSGIVDWFALQTAAFVEQVVGEGSLPPCQSMRGELRTMEVLDAVVRCAAGDGSAVSLG